MLTHITILYSVYVCNEMLWEDRKEPRGVRPELQAGQKLSVTWECLIQLGQLHLLRNVLGLANSSSQADERGEGKCSLRKMHLVHRYALFMHLAASSLQVHTQLYLRTME